MSMKITTHHLQHPLPKPPVKKTETGKSGSPNFKNLLENNIEKQRELKISKHAEKRLIDRDIKLSRDTWVEIGQKIKEAKQKGIKDSLVLTNEACFVISAENGTVITAMHREEAASQVFTNINGAIIVND
jgi:flagellar operon protein